MITLTELIGAMAADFQTRAARVSETPYGASRSVDRSTTPVVTIS